MAIDYGLIGRFNQVQPGGLTQAFRGGVDLRGQMLQNQAQGFANQQAPILADRATQKWNQDLANLQAQEQETLAQAQAKQAEIQQKKIEADQKRYTDSMSIMGRSLYSINDESQVPVVLSSLKTMADSGVINPDVFYNIPGVREGRMPTLKEIEIISKSLIDTKDQLIQKREEAKAKREAEQQLIDNALKNKEFSLKERQLAESIRSNKEREKISLAGVNKPSAQEKADIATLKTIPTYLTPYLRGDQILTKQDVLKIKEKTPATASFIKSINQVMNIVDNGGVNVVNPTSKDYAKLSPLITDLGAKYRTIANLGVPNAGDQALTNSFIGDPTNLKNQIKQLPEILNQAKSLILTGYNDEMNVYGFDPIPEESLVGKKTGANLPPAGAFKTKTGLTYEVIP